MNQVVEFIKLLKSEFPDDRITFQRNIATFHPESASETSRLFKIINKENQPAYITGFGNNISPVGKLFIPVLAIKSDRLNRIEQINPDDFYIKVGSGYPLREINKALQPHNLWLPHSDLPYVGSVGGSISVDLNADYHSHDMPLKKYFIQAEIVTPDGEIITPGSVCFKSVSGYDVVKIFAGAWGLLGMIISATFRVMPISGKDDYASIKMKNITPNMLAQAFKADNQNPNAVYTRKIKSKFDPNNILPIINQ